MIAASPIESSGRLGEYAEQRVEDLALILDALDSRPALEHVRYELVLPGVGQLDPEGGLHVVDRRRLGPPLVAEPLLEGRERLLLRLEVDVLDDRLELG